ncbi:unnamed protein product [Cercospora beticola]|nr:unnamed protein product [Cercospora beticola]
MIEGAIAPQVMMLVGADPATSPTALTLLACSDDASNFLHRSASRHMLRARRISLRIKGNQTPLRGALFSPSQRRSKFQATRKCSATLHNTALVAPQKLDYNYGDSLLVS